MTTDAAELARLIVFCRDAGHARDGACGQEIAYCADMNAIAAALTSLETAERERDAARNKLEEFARHVHHYREVESIYKNASFNDLVPVTHGEVEALSRLAEAGTWFREYEQHHKEKGALDKAQRNAERAEFCEHHASRTPAKGEGE